MHKLSLYLVTLAIAVGIGCTSGDSAQLATPGPGGATEIPLATPVDNVALSATVTPEEFFLSVSSPENESVVDQSAVEVRGSTVLSGVVTVNGQVIEVDTRGEFAAPVDLEVGPNAVEIIASDFSGHEEAWLVSVIYIP